MSDTPGKEMCKNAEYIDYFDYSLENGKRKTEITRRSYLYNLRYLKGEHNEQRT